MEKFTKDTLQSLIGDQVSVITPEAKPAYLTISATENSVLNGDEWEAFHVTLKGDDSFQLSQGTYSLSHAAFGELDLFLSPNSATEYEIVINRKRS